MSSTRLLLLGVLATCGKPIHGYEVRAELESWGAERWANVAYGSIYFGLAKMEDEGLLEVVDTGDAATRRGRGARIVYQVSERGRAEFQRLLLEEWHQVKRAVDPFYVALTFMTELPRDELLAALRRRTAVQHADLEFLDHISTSMARDPGPVPRHIVETKRLAAAHLRAEVEWAEQLIAKVERGELP